MRLKFWPDKGIEIEIINVRTIVPLKDAHILESASRTGNCIVVDNEWLHCGLSTEIAARVMEGCFGRLNSPATRMGWRQIPCPTVRCLEDEIYPNAVAIIRAVEEKLDLAPTDPSDEAFYSYANRFKGPF